MHKSKCPVCGSVHTVKNGLRKRVQLYICRDCGYQFRNSSMPSDNELWRLYQENKQTMAELAAALHMSRSSIRRRLARVQVYWEQPELAGLSGYVHLDATYWGRNSGIMVGMDSRTGQVLYMAFITHEKLSDYQHAVASIEERGYVIRGLIVDGNQAIFKQFGDRYRIQMCQFHMKQIVKRYLTRNPKLLAARELKELVKHLTRMEKDDFVSKYSAWKVEFRETISRRSVLKNGKTQYRHRRLRSVMHSLDFYLPYLFTFQDPQCRGMPNTNNKLEGTFTDLKKNLNSHSGLAQENRERLIDGFFLALNEALGMKRQGPH